MNGDDSEKRGGGTNEICDKTKRNRNGAQTCKYLLERNTIKICLPKKTTKINSPNTENNNE